LDALIPVTYDFLNRLAEETNRSQYDVVGFSLTISQTAASMALARLIKRQYPDITIVFGGASCAGPMGPAVLRICPYVDVVVGVEGEPVLPELIRRIQSRQALDDLAGVSYRGSNGDIVTHPGGPLYQDRGSRPHLRFDAYFERLDALGLREKVDVWLPFESSRGCWYGEKNQCSNSRSLLVRPIRTMSERVSLVYLTNPSVNFETPDVQDRVSNPELCCVWPPWRCSSAQIVDSRRFGSSHRDRLRRRDID
jgi:hypothetical protein